MLCVLQLDEEVIAELCPEEKADTIKEDDSKLKENEEEKACVEGGSMSENFATVAIQVWYGIHPRSIARYFQL